KVEQTYLIMISALSQHERVNVLVDDKNTELRIRKILSSTKSNLNNLSFYIIKTSDVWIRDYGPNFVINKERKIIAMNSWQFNAWGEKYTKLMNDNDIPERINTHLKIPIFKTGIVLEGGSIDVNGEGSCLTTEQCLLNK
ncbi:MAG: agmatine deiminase family protein, partial [Nanoarchaeota archaeon]